MLEALRKYVIAQSLLLTLCPTQIARADTLTMYADQFTGADACAKINAAILSTLGHNVVIDARGFTGAQTCASDPFANVAVAGELDFGEATFSTSATLSVPSNWTINCAYGGRTFGRGSNDLSPKGTTFTWTGAPNLPVFKLFNTHHQQVFGCTVDGGMRAGSVGFLLDAKNAGGTGLHNVYIDHYNCYRILNCIQVGTDPKSTFEIDKWAFEFGHVESFMPASAAIVLLGAGNIGSDSSIEKLWTFQTDIGVDLSQGTAGLTLRDICCGERVTEGQDNPCIKVVAADNLTIIGGESESADPYTTDIHMIKSGSCLSTMTITLINRQISNPVVDECPAQLVSIGANTNGGSSNFGSAPVNIASATRAANGKVTIITQTPHGLCATNATQTCAVIVASVKGGTTDFNGAFIVTAIINPKEFQYAQPSLLADTATAKTGTSQKSLGIVNGNTAQFGNSALQLVSIGEKMNVNGTTGIINGWTVFGGALAVQLGSFESILFDCASAVSPAICGFAPTGSFTIPPAATSATVNTTAVAPNSRILLQEDSSLGAKLGVKCNTTTGRTYTVSSKVIGASFTVVSSATPVVSPVCLSYSIIN